MDNRNCYSVLGDDCETCHYLENALTLLCLPFNKISMTDLISCDDGLPGITALFVCKHKEEEHGKHILQKMDGSSTHLISFNETQRIFKSSNKAVHFLKSLFNQSQLLEILTHCHNSAGDDDFIDSIPTHPIFERLLGQSQEIRKIRTMIKQVANSDSTVLILGESGTGKDVIASCIHYLSNRKDKPLVPINCGAIPSELMESELFGHEKGAFTGAMTRRAGRFEIADSGTLFLDEIGDMPLPMQVKLLRVIQDRMIERVGGNTSIKVDVRLIAATNKNLEELMQQEKFREDLFYRLNVFPIKVPSLSERKDDIPTLINYHLEKIYDRLKHRVIFTENAKTILCQYAWPGNIRELENFLERMVILHRDQVLDVNDLDPIYKQEKASKLALTPPLSNEPSLNIKEYITHVERQLIEYSLERSNGMIQVAADYLSLGRKTLIEKMKKYDIPMTLQDANS